MTRWFGGVVVCIGVLAGTTFGAEYLVKLKSTTDEAKLNFTQSYGGTLSLVSQPGKLYKWVTEDARANQLRQDLGRSRNTGVEFVERNRRIQLFQNPVITENREQILKVLAENNVDLFAPRAQDNPAIKVPVSETTGMDPKLAQDWGIQSSGAKAVWDNNNFKTGNGVIVAVIDTGVDYNHEDLINNMWRNPNEIAGDGIDNDQNGYIDDIVGWDFVDNENKPFDLVGNLFQILAGGNPGHGTHCAGVVGARRNNGKGTAGVAPDVEIMAIRFIGDKGGEIAAAVGSIDYAVANGAKVISASWGSMGEEPGENALKEAITRAEQAGVLFVAAAGNGRVDMIQGTATGYDNDTDAEAVVPASYPHANIVAVAAVDSSDAIGSFSNWGKKTVDMGAPGVKVFSTVPGNKYQDTVLDLTPFGMDMVVTWDGTSMATPHVAGAAAVLLSQDLTLPLADLKAKLMTMTRKTSAMTSKTVTDGQLDLRVLVNE